MKLGEGRTQLTWGAAIALMLVCVFYVRIPGDVSVFGVPIKQAYLTALTGLSFIAMLAVAYRELMRHRNADALGLVNCVVFALWLSAQVHDRILMIVNLFAVAIDLLVLAMILMRRNRPRVTQ
jgi:hypothetical protein